MSFSWAMFFYEYAKYRVELMQINLAPVTSLARDLTEYKYVVSNEQVCSDMNKIQKQIGHTSFLWFAPVT